MWHVGLSPLCVLWTLSVTHFITNEPLCLKFYSKSFYHIQIGRMWTVNRSLCPWSNHWWLYHFPQRRGWKTIVNVPIATLCLLYNIVKANFNRWTSAISLAHWLCPFELCPLRFSDFDSSSCYHYTQSPKMCVPNVKTVLASSVTAKTVGFCTTDVPFQQGFYKTRRKEREKNWKYLCYVRVMQHEKKNQESHDFKPLCCHILAV